MSTDLSDATALPTSDTASGSELTVATLESKLAPVAAEWKTLGRKLGLEEWRLKNIAADIPLGRGASMKRLNAVLDEWCTNATDRSWSNIVCALKKMDESILAREIEINYCRPTQGLLQQQSEEEIALALTRTNEISIKDCFAQLQTFINQKIQARLDAKEIKIGDFWLYMTNLFPPGKCIPETSDVSEIFTAITRCSFWDYLNYEPLVRVAKMYGGEDPDLIAKLEKYTEDFIGYKVVTKMALYLSSNKKKSPSPVKNFRTKLTLKLRIPVSELSLIYVDEIWKSLARLFLLSPHSSALAILDKTIEGSLQITWLIPAFFVPQMMEKAKQHEIVKFFQEMKAVLVTVDGACLYEEQEDSSDGLFDEDQEPPPKAEGLATAVDSIQEESVELVADQPSNEISIKDRFAQLQTLISQKIQVRINTEEIKIGDFWVYMTNLFPPGKCIPETSDVSEIFTAITCCGFWDYLNCEPLVRVAKMYGGEDPELMAKLEKYTEDLKRYKVVTKIAPYLSMVTDTSNENKSPSPVKYDQSFRTKLTLKLQIPVSELSLTYVDETWNSLARMFLLPRSSAILDKIIEGSLHITWLIPAFFVPQMMEMAKQPEVVKFFQEMKAVLVTVDGACLYEEQEDSSDGLFDEDQEPPPKAEGLATAVDSIQEESVELVADQHHDTQAQFSSACGVEENQSDGEKLSSKQDKPATATISHQEGVVMATDRALQEITLEESPLTSVKPVNDKPSLHLRSHPEGQKILQSSGVKGQGLQQSSEAKGQGLPQLSILVCGRTGIGKSTLINNLFGEDVCEVGDPGEESGASFGAKTKHVEGYLLPNMHGVQVTIYDSPGLQDGTGNDEKYLHEMYLRCQNVNLVFYCHDMPNPRWTNQEVNAIRLLTAKFGPTFWDKAIFVLTKANMVQPAKVVTEEEYRKYFHRWNEKSARIFKREVVEQLKVLHLEANKIQKCVDSIPVVPAGNESVQILPDGKQFIGNLWVNCIERIPDQNLSQTFMQATNIKERLVTNKESKQNSRLPIVLNRDLTARLAVLLNNPTVKWTAGGATVGAVVGSVIAPGIGTAIGGAVGAGVGAGLGLAGWLWNRLSK